MPEKSSLSLVGSTASRRKPKQTGADLIKTISSEYELEGGGLALLRQTGDALDRLNQISEAISKDGLMLRWGKGRRSHPLLRIEQSLRVLISQNLGRLGLDLEPIGDVGRPGGGGFGVTGRDWDDEDDEGA